MKKLFLLTSCFCSILFVSAQQDSTLKEYVGIYKFPDGSPVPNVEITIQDGNLFGNSANGSATLTKVSRDTFSIPSFNGMAYFKRNANGKISGIKIELTDVTMEGEKEGVGSLQSAVGSRESAVRSPQSVVSSGRLLIENSTLVKSANTHYYFLKSSV